MTFADAPSVAADGTPPPPDSWPGAAGRRSVAPLVPAWPGQPVADPAGPGASWPGAEQPPPRPADLDEAALAELTTRRPRHRVAPAARRLWALRAGLGWLVPLLVVSAWILLDHRHRPTQALLFGGVVLLALAHMAFMPRWRYRVHRWEVSDRAVYTQTGWFHEQTRIAPIARIQTVDSESGPLERMFDLGTLTVTTASAAGPLRVSGLHRDTVRRLVDELTHVTAATSNDAT